MVQKLSAGLLLNSELTVVAQRLVDATEKALSSESIIQKASEVIRFDIDQVEAALGRVQSSEFTSQIAEQDQQRDDAFVALRDFAKASSSRTNQKVADAGSFIYGIFEARGLTLYRLGYTQQTAAMNLLLEDLSTDEAKEALAAMNGTSWFEDLQSAQAAFEHLVSTKAELESQQGIPPLRISRAALTDSVEALLSCVGVIQRFEERNGDTNTQEALTELIGTINEITSDAMSIARARRTRDEATDEQEPSLVTSAV